METINIIENKVEVIKQDYTLYNKEVLHACFVTGATYQVPSQNLISKGVEVQFKVVKNTHKSVTIEVVEKYNGAINTSKAVKRLNAGGVGFWKTIKGVEYATVETFNATKLTRWVKGYINPFNCELATKELKADDVQNVATAEPVEKVEKVLDFTPVFYAIDEKMARLAREMNSFREYEENSTTEHYKARVEEVFSIAEKNQSEKSLYLANIYAKKYAEYINNSNRIDCMYPSIMICGSGNFNVRKKEKQNARRENLSRDFEKLQNLLEKIKRPEGWGYAEIKRDTIVSNEFDGVQFFKVVTNEEVNRLQLVDFEEIPTDEHKSILKHNGFKWSPRFKAWQRQLTENAINGVWRVVREFERLENEEIEELHATIQENKPVEPVEEVPKAEPLTPCDCFKCPLGKKCKHYQAYRRHPRDIGGLGLCHILTGTLQEKLRELEKAEPVEEVPKAEPVEPVAEVEPVENAEPVEPVAEVEPVENAELVEPVENAELVEPVAEVEPVQKDLTRNEMISILNRLLRTYYNNKLVDLLSTFSDKQLKTIYIMLLCYGSSIWVKDDKVRLYLNNGFNFVKTEKLELIKPNVWVGKNKFDWYKWEVNGLQTYEVFKHSKDDKAYCWKLSNEFIELNLYYDVINNKFVFEDDIFKVTKTVIEKIKSDVKDIKLLPVQEVPNAEPVEEIPNTEPVEPVEKAEPVAEVEKAEPVAEVEKAEPVADVEKAEPVAEVEKAEPVAEVEKAEPVADVEKAEPVAIDVNDEINKQDEVVDYSTLTDNDLHDVVLSQLDNINDDLIETCLNYEFMGYGKYVPVDTNEFMDVTPALAEYNRRFGVDEIFCLIYRHLSNIKTHVEYDSFDDTMYIVKVEPVQDDEVESVEPVEKVGLDINTSYPELQCFEDIEKVEKNTIFKVGCVYTGSDKSLYLVTKRGLNTIDLMSISKGFQEYDIPIVTDIYDNEYTTISYSNSISVISSIDIKYTEKNFKRTLYDFVNNNFYGNDVYGKYDVEDVERVLNMLYGKIID